MSVCQICAKPTLEKRLDFGLQPISHHFLQSHEEALTYPLELGQCAYCGTMQLLKFFPVEALVPRFNWLNCTEPEGHLDDLVHSLMQLPNIDSDSKIMGVSFKEDTTLSRFNKLNYFNTKRIDSDELGISHDFLSIESVQSNLTVENAKSIVARQGLSDMVIARHIIEHANDLHEFIEACKTLVSQKGYLVFEVPDCELAFAQLDYSVIWEEHTIYFTQNTFKQLFSFMGLKLVDFKRIKYKHEDSYVAVAVKENVSLEKLDVDVVNAELAMGTRFSESFSLEKKRLHDKLRLLKNQYGPIAFYGAGHMSSVYINLMEIRQFLECVIDDNANFINLHMPVSKLAILPLARAVDKQVKVFIMTVSEGAQEAILRKNPWLLEAGVVCCSIFPGSRISMEKEVEYANKDKINLQKNDMNRLVQHSKHTRRERYRLCTHLATSDLLHEMFIVHKKGTYVRPHKHVNKAESLHIIEGEVDVLLFNDKGDVTEVFSMGEYPSGKPFYYRLNKDVFHTLIIRTPNLIFHEVTTGPFQRADTIFASWAPSEEEPVAIKAFLDHLEVCVAGLVDLKEAVFE